MFSCVWWSEIFQLQSITCESERGCGWIIQRRAIFIRRSQWEKCEAEWKCVIQRWLRNAGWMRRNEDETVKCIHRFSVKEADGEFCGKLGRRVRNYCTFLKPECLVQTNKGQVKTLRESITFGSSHAKVSIMHISTISLNHFYSALFPISAKLMDTSCT